MAELQNFSVSQNTDDEIAVLVESSLTLNTLAGMTIEWSVYEVEFGVPLRSPVMIHKTTSSGITVPSSPAMTFDIAIDHADTASLDLGVYYHEAILIDGGGNRSLILFGLMAVTLAI